MQLRTISPRLTHIFASVFACLACAAVANSATIDFEDLALPGPNSSFNGDTGAVPVGMTVVGTFNSGGGTFPNTFTNFGGGFTTWDGWSYSNRTDTTTPGFGNQYSAITGSGFGGSSNYAIGFDPTPFSTAVPTIMLPAGERPVSIQVTNTTYAYLAIANGDAFARQFGDDPNLAGNGNQGEPDFFLLSITGRDGMGAVTGVVDHYLADYRDPSNLLDYALSDWSLVDLSGLPSLTEELEFRLTTTDVGGFGANTPFFFALDNVVTTSNNTAGPVPAPEPSTLAVWACIAVAISSWRLAKMRISSVFRHLS